MTQHLIRDAITPEFLAGTRTRKRTGELPMVVTFLVGVLAFASAMYHNLSGPQICTTFFGDSRHYLDSCARLALALHGLFSGVSISTESLRALAENLMMDGPVLPTVPSLYFAIINHVPTPLERVPFIAIGSLWCALDAVVVCLLGYRLTGNRIAAAVSGIGWATYGPAVQSAGRFLTEGPTALILLGSVLLADRIYTEYNRYDRVRFGSAAALGGLIGIALLLKPVMLPAVVIVGSLTLLFVWRTGKEKSGLAPAGTEEKKQSGLAPAGTILVSAFVGALIILAPWMVFTKLATGEAHLMPERAPTYNIAKGCDTDADGWGALPESPLTETFATIDSAPVILKTAANYKPTEFCSLMARKILRLWSVPWNDFRTTVFGASPDVQLLWHKLLWILALPGAVAVLARACPVTGAAWRRDGAHLISWCSIAIIASHLVYVPFEAIARYGYSAMPFITLLAMYGIFVAARISALRNLTALLLFSGLTIVALSNPSVVSLLVGITRDFSAALLVQLICITTPIALAAITAWIYITRMSDTSRPSATAIAKLIVLSGAALAATTAWGNYADGREFRSWACELNDTSVAKREVMLPETIVSSNSTAACVLLDGDASVEDAIITVNGHRLTSKPISIYRSLPKNYNGLNIMRLFAAKLNRSTETIRQWRTAPIPTDWLRANANNVITVCPPVGKAVTIYGDYDDVRQPKSSLPAFQYFSGGMFCNETKYFEGRLSNPVGNTKRTAQSSLQAGTSWSSDLSAQPGHQSGQYRMFIMLCDPSAQPTPATAQSQPFSKTFAPTDFDPVLRNDLLPEADITINRRCLKVASSMGQSVPLPPEYVLPSYGAVTISGFIKAVAGNCTASVVPILVGPSDSNYSMILPSTPTALKASGQWVPFKITDIVPFGFMPQPIKSIRLSFYPGNWEETAEYGCIRRTGDASFKQLAIAIKPIDVQTLSTTRMRLY